MISDIVSKLNALCIVLGSSSPRRQELLKRIGLQFLVVKSNFPENLDKGSYKLSHEYIRETALKKLTDVKTQVEESVHNCRLIIGADTVVVLDGQIMEKPASAEEAKLMLRALSGRRHEVVSSCVVFYRREGDDSWRTEQFETTTGVHFASLPESLIEAYVATGDSFDKSGGYGAQGVAGSFIESLDGDFFNVVGLPIQPLSACLRRIVEANF